MKKRSSFLIFFFASLIAAIGSGMTSFGIGVYVFQRTKSAFIKSIISLLAFLPTVLAGPFAGILADRYDRRKLMVLADGLSSLGILVILYGLHFAQASIFLIGCGVFISALFSSLIEPASKASISDLVSENDYTKASGLLQLAGSARFLLAPILCAIVMGQAGLKGVLLVDLFTIVTTMASILLIANDFDQKNSKSILGHEKTLKQGLAAIRNTEGIAVLILFSIFLTFVVGTMQDLSTPLILSFADVKSLSLVISIASLGMVASSLYLGLRGIRTDKIRTFCFSAFLTGASMLAFAGQENIILVTIFAFVFFATLPFINAIADYLVRTNIPNALQGRVFGIISTLSQLGYLLAFALSGFLADFVFEPFLSKDIPLTGLIGKIIGFGPGRSIGLLIICEGLILMATSIFLSKNKSFYQLKGERNVLNNH